MSEELFNYRQIRSIIRDIEPFPEYKCKIDKHKSSLHAAAYLGNNLKLNELLKNINHRYECIEYGK